MSMKYGQHTPRSICGDPQPGVEPSCASFPEGWSAFLDLVRRFCAETWPTETDPPHPPACSRAQIANLRWGLDRAFLWGFAFDELLELLLEKCNASVETQGSLPEELKRALLEGGLEEREGVTAQHLVLLATTPMWLAGMWEAFKNDDSHYWVDLSDRLAEEFDATLPLRVDCDESEEQWVDCQEGQLEEECPPEMPMSLHVSEALVGDLTPSGIDPWEHLACSRRWRFPLWSFTTGVAILLAFVLIWAQYRIPPGHEREVAEREAATTGTYSYRSNGWSKLLSWSVPTDERAWEWIVLPPGRFETLLPEGVVPDPTTFCISSPEGAFYAMPMPKGCKHVRLSMRMQFFPDREDMDLKDASFGVFFGVRRSGDRRGPIALYRFSFMPDGGLEEDGTGDRIRRVPNGTAQLACEVWDDKGHSLASKQCGRSESVILGKGWTDLTLDITAEAVVINFAGVKHEDVNADQLRGALDEVVKRVKRSILGSVDLLGDFTPNAGIGVHVTGGKLVVDGCRWIRVR